MWITLNLEFMRKYLNRTVFGYSWLGRYLYHYIDKIPAVILAYIPDNQNPLMTPKITAGIF